MYMFVFYVCILSMCEYVFLSVYICVCVGVGVLGCVQGTLPAHTAVLAEL